MTEKEILKILLKEYKRAVKAHLSLVKENEMLSFRLGRVSAFEEMILSILSYKRRVSPCYTTRATRKIEGARMGGKL